jgi:serine/threonine protein kinase
LQKLALAGNRLSHLPLSLAQCENLELIRISANKLSHFPEQLLALPKLAWFAFSGNPFSLSEQSIETIPQISSSTYTLQEVLGQGASGVISKAVWKTEQDRFPDEIAVKVFKGEVTSDGYPQDELQACLKVGSHPNLVRSLAQVKEKGYLALVMSLIPADYSNLGLPPTFESCTRDDFPSGFTLGIKSIVKIIGQMDMVFAHLHENKVCHGDLYAHNTLFDQQGNIIFGDFGAASMYHMLSEVQQLKIKQIEGRALHYFIEDLLSLCPQDDKHSIEFNLLKQRVSKQ